MGYVVCFVGCWGLGLLVFGLCIVGLVGEAWLFGWVRGCWWLIICYIHVFCLPHTCTATTTGRLTWGVVF